MLILRAAKVQIMQHRAFTAIVVAFAILTQAYSAFLPTYEGPDEYQHMAYILLVRQQGRLPHPEFDFDSPVRQESSQPPLYYVTAALYSFALPFDYGNVSSNPPSNPWRGLGAPEDYMDNRNTYMMIPGGHIMDDTLLNEIQIASWLRRFSLVYGVLTLITVYAGALTLWPTQRWLALGSVALFAFNPQMLQAFATITNDTAVILFGALTLTTSLHLRRHPHSVKLALLGGLFAGLGMLAKANGLILIVAPVMALLVGWRQQKGTIGQLIRQGMIIGVAAFAAGGWWYLRSLILFGDLDGSSTHIQMPWATNAPLTPAVILERLLVTLRSGWADLSWGATYLPWIAYIIPVSLVGIGVFGWLRRGIHSDAVMMLVTLAAAMAGILYWMTISTYVPGRLLLHVFPAVSWLVALGWERLSARLLPVTASGLVGTQALTGLYILYMAFIPPGIVNTPPENLQGQPINFSSGAQFIGYQIDDDRIATGSEHWVTLCWRAPEGDSAIEVPHAFALHLVGDGDTRLAARDSYPGLGRYTYWQAGGTFCEKFRYTITGALQDGRVYPLRLKMYNPDTLEEVPYQTVSGTVDNRIGYLRAPAQTQFTAEAAAQPIAVFNTSASGQLLLLDSVSGGNTLELTWGVQGEAPRRNLNIFIHVIDQNGALVAQSDPLLGGEIYPSWAWSSGEQITQTIPFPVEGLDDGEYQLLIGVYELDTFARLSAQTADGSPAENNAVLLQTLSVQ